MAPWAVGNIRLANTILRYASSRRYRLHVLAILAHYRLLFGRERRGERTNPEPTERWIVISTAVICLGLFVWLLIIVYELNL